MSTTNDRNGAQRRFAWVSAHNLRPSLYTESMNINQTLAAMALIIFCGVSVFAAYGMRYAPMQGDGVSNPVLVWDRWQQKVCQISFVSHDIYCAQVQEH
jgi:hypothetical protein